MAHRSIHVEIMGRRYPLKVVAGGEEHARRMAAHVSERATAIKKRLRGQSDMTCLAMAAMAITEELFASQHHLAAAERFVAAEADALRGHLEAALDTAAAPVAAEAEAPA